MGRTYAYDPYVFNFLVRKAQANELTTYGEVASYLNQAVPTQTSPRAMRFCLHRIKAACITEGLPPLTALVVDKISRLPGDGLFDGLGNLSKSQKLEIFGTMQEKVYGNDWTEALLKYGFE
jgi:hypothetical protein